jgi:hypothetical protein
MQNEGTMVMMSKLKNLVDSVSYKTQSLIQMQSRTFYTSVFYRMSKND